MVDHFSHLRTLTTASADCIIRTMNISTRTVGLEHLAPRHLLGTYQILIRRGRTLIAAECWALSLDAAQAYAERTVWEYGDRARVESVAPWYGPQPSHDPRLAA